MTLSLAITDTADGTGGTATVGGVGVTAAVTLYRSAYTGAMGAYSWTSTGTRVGSGTIAVNPGTGYYLWQAISVDGGVTEVGHAVYQNLTDAATISFHKQILAAVKTGIVSLGLSGVSSTKIKERWLPRVYENVEAPPEVWVCPPGEETYPGGLTSTDDVGYPVVVAMIDKLQGDVAANLNRDLLWRQKIARLFRFQHLQGVPGTYFGEIYPGPIVDMEAWRHNYLVSVLVFRFVHRESRGIS